MSNIMPFNFEGMDVRITDVGGDPWFIAKDVAGILGYTNPRKAVADHCKKAQKVGGNESLPPQDIGCASFHERPHVVGAGNTGRPLDPQTTIIPEMDVYRLIMRSKLPSAERFQDWVTGEVLPSIRKTKSYSLDRQAYLREALHDVPSLQFLVHECTVKIQTLQDEVAESQPKVEAFNRIAVSDGGMCITNAAKTLGVRPKDLFFFLSGAKWIYRRQGSKNWLAYQDKIQRGVLDHKVTEATHSDGTNKIHESVRVTPKGLSHLATLPKVKALTGIFSQVAC